MANTKRQNERGVVISAELIFILTILVIGLVVGWVAVRNSVVAELHDVAEAIGIVDQSFEFSGTNDPATNTSTDGSEFNDSTDNGFGGGSAGTGNQAGDGQGIQLARDNFGNEDINP